MTTAIALAATADRPVHLLPRQGSAQRIHLPVNDEDIYAENGFVDRHGFTEEMRSGWTSTCAA